MNRSDVMEHFGASVNQASTSINRYLAQPHSLADGILDSEDTWIADLCTELSAGRQQDQQIVLINHDEIHGGRS